ncbi:MAG TPA: flagellar assembly protein FliW, partial [Pirellulales bacterium]|nr:flagellar assembly protein FliW [Pirellulales bacterium]
QSTERAEIALAVVSPRRFAPGYEVRIPRGELQPLALDSLESAHVLAVVSKNEERITLNLKAPLIINLARRLGRQVINNADQPIQFEIGDEPAARRKIA